MTNLIRRADSLQVQHRWLNIYPTRSSGPFATETLFAVYQNCLVLELPCSSGYAPDGSRCSLFRKNYPNLHPQVIARESYSRSAGGKVQRHWGHRHPYPPPFTPHTSTIVLSFPSPAHLRHLVVKVSRRSVGQLVRRGSVVHEQLIPRQVWHQDAPLIVLSPDAENEVCREDEHKNLW